MFSSFFGRFDDNDVIMIRCLHGLIIMMIISIIIIIILVIREGI